MSDMDDIIKEFLVESYENLDQLDRDFVALEQDPTAQGTLGNIFRTIHTIKGTCGFLGLSKLESVAHVGESLLSRLRDGLLLVTPEIATTLLHMVDAIRNILANIENTEQEGDEDYQELIATLTRLQEDAPPAEAAESSEAAPPEVSASSTSEAEERSDPGSASAQGAVQPDTTTTEATAEPTLPHPETVVSATADSAETYAIPEASEAASPPAETSASENADGMQDSASETSPPHPKDATEEDEPKSLSKPMGELLVEMGHVKPEHVAEALLMQQNGDTRHLGEILIEQGIVEPKTVREALQTQESKGRSVSDSSIRVDVNLLDKLMNLVGELVLTRNQILQFVATQEDSVFIATGQRLNLITTELQESIMKTRMQPIGNIWSKFPRIVRDLAQACGKQVRIEMEGKETELDKTLIEAIKDPLTHVVRNAVDHGIEAPDVRTASGKPAEGCLLLRAYHEGGQVNIEITDDGIGIDSERIKRKALERGLITPEHAARMGERDLVNLIFLPGFSTAEKITNVSGRGVGMDVVKTNIEKIGGSVDILSTRGKGSTLKVKIPLTLAIIPALIVTTKGERYAIPQVSLLELVRLEGEQIRSNIEMIHGAPVYRLRGNLLPLLYLNRELQLEEPVAETDSAATETTTINIVVLQADDRQFGLVVDDINDTEEIVVKPLGKQLKGISAFAGATIMGDGRVALILDVLGIAQKGQVIIKERDRAVGDQATHALEPTDEQQLLLLLGVGDEGRAAIPLSMVARLEEIPRHAVERAGGQEVVQYRGQIMPLASLSSILQAYGTGGDVQETLQVVVFTKEDRSIGLIVDRILDVTQESLALQHDAGSDGVLGSAVIQQHVTDLLDVPGIIRTVDPTFFERPAVAEAEV